VAQKRVELLRELVPDLQTLAVLSNTNHPGEQAEHEVTKAAASTLSIGLAYVPFASGLELYHALEHVRVSGAGAMLVFPEGVTMVHRAKIADFARTQHLAAMFVWRGYCEAGGLMSYGANQRATYLRLATYADRLLRGERPGDLPVEQPTTFELIVNLGTARALGLTVPPSLFSLVDGIID
jgi:putative ABC transport system substrate-binding protein